VLAGLSNALVATLLAAVVWGIARYARQPALAHVLWVVVLLKLLTPPLVTIPVGWKFDLDWAVPRLPSLADVAPELAEQPIAESHVPSGVQAGLTVAEGEQTAGLARDEASYRENPPKIEQPGTGWMRQTASATSQGATRFRLSGFTARLRTTSTVLVSWLPVVWLCGVAIRALLLIQRAWAFRAFIRRAGAIDPALSRRAWELAHGAGMWGAPQVITVQGAVSPMLWGAGGRVHLIFPAGLARELPPQARDALLLHELAHFSRGDQWVRLIELAAQVLYWWHPVVWWARREIEGAEEQCCDAWVVERQSGSRRTYAEALLATIDFLCEQPAMLPPAASGLGAVPLLRIRLTQIMCGEVAARLSSGVRTAVLICAMAILPLGPALFGASVQTERSVRLPRATMRAAALPARAEPRTAEGSTAPPVDNPSISPITSRIEESLSGINLAPAIRPPAAVTATATSRNGKYLLERRKGSHVTLVNRALDWRLDMSTHGILCVAFTPDSRLFVTGHEDGLVRVWDSETGGLAATLRGCSDAVWSVSVAPGQSGEFQVAAGGKDGSVLVWDLGSHEQVAWLPPAESSVSCLRWSPRGDKLAISFGDFSARDQDSLQIWSPRDNALLARLALDRPAAALVWLEVDERLVVADWSGNTQIWQVSDASPQCGISLGPGGKQIVEAAHWSADCPLVDARLAEEPGLGVQ
jgi:bla regulator protein blaR1